jgi:putative membrane protein
VEKLTDAVGQCERIHQTAVPLNYARHSLRSLTLWLFTLPFALVKDLGLLTAPVTACIAWLLFGVYQIGYSIEDPFQGTLRLSILCDAIRRDVLGKTSGGDVEDDGRDERWTDNDRVEPLLLDETLLNAPKLVQAFNGTWNVVGLVGA